MKKCQTFPGIEPGTIGVPVEHASGCAIVAGRVCVCVCMRKCVCAYIVRTYVCIIHLMTKIHRMKLVCQKKIEGLFKKLLQ